jgi:hypothetical protein
MGEWNRVLDVNPKAHDGNGSAHFVVTGIRDVLPVGREGNASPDVRGVMGLEDFLQAIGEAAVA